MTKERMAKKTRFAVMVFNFETKKYQVMKLIYDPRTGKNGEAIYDNREDAVFAKYIAQSISGGSMKVKVQKIV